MFVFSSKLPTKELSKPSLSIVLLVIAGAAALGSIRLLSKADSGAAASVSPHNEAIQPQNRFEVQRIILRPSGFEPAELTRPAGRFLLALDDRSGERDVSFILQRSNGERLKEFRLRDTPRKYEWREVVTLSPGRYLLIDSTNPERVCHIHLTN